MMKGQEEEERRKDEVHRRKRRSPHLRFSFTWDSAGDMHLMSLQFHAQGKRGVFAEANGRDTWQQDERQDRIVNGTQDTRCAPPNY